MEFKPGSRAETLYGAEAEIEKLLGAGGQGYVYKVRYNGRPKAMKIYKPGAIADPKAFYSNLKSNIQRGSPSAEFLWPQDLVVPVSTPVGETFGYIMELRPEGFEELSAFLAGCVRFASMRTAVDAALQIVAAFRVLHNRGYSYQDLNDGNFFIDPRSGRVLICDNDNVAPTGTNTGVLGKPRYMAPEIVRGEARPSTATDRFSLAVIIFLTLCLTHPLEGSRYLVPCLTPSVEAKLYGYEPIFLLDPEDKRNAPVRGIHKNIGLVWPELPSYMKDAFLREFSREVLFNPNLRSTEAEWQKLLMRMRADIVRCPCGDEVLASSETDYTCRRCGRQLPYFDLLRLSGCGYDMPACNGGAVFRLQLGTADVDEAGRAVLYIRRNPKNPQQVAVQNVSGETAECVTPSGRLVPVENGRAAPVRPGIKIRIGDGTAEVIARPDAENGNDTEKGGAENEHQ